MKVSHCVQACMTELQQLVSGVATQAYRKGFVSTVTSCSLVDRAPLFRDAQLPVENVKINTEKQIAVMQEAIRQLQVSNSDDSMAIMLHTRLHSLMGQLALLQGGGGPSRADSTKEIYAQLKERFPVSNLAVEITHSENRAQFSTCTGCFFVSS